MGKLRLWKHKSCVLSHMTGNGRAWFSMQNCDSRAQGPNPYMALSPLWLPEHYYSTLDSSWISHASSSSTHPTSLSDTSLFVLMTPLTPRPPGHVIPWPPSSCVTVTQQNGHILEWVVPEDRHISTSQIPDLIVTFSVLSSFPPTHFYLYCLSPLYETMTWVIGVHQNRAQQTRTQGPNVAQHFCKQSCVGTQPSPWVTCLRPLSHMSTVAFRLQLWSWVVARDPVMWPAKPKRFTMLTWPRKSFPCSPGAMFLGQAHSSDYIHPPPCHWENWIWHWRAAGRENEAEVRELAGELCLFGPPHTVRLLTQAHTCHSPALQPRAIFLPRNPRNSSLLS